MTPPKLKGTWHALAYEVTKGKTTRQYVYVGGGWFYRDSLQNRNTRWVHIVGRVTVIDSSMIRTVWGIAKATTEVEVTIRGRDAQ